MSELEPSLPMCLLEQGDFLLGYRPKTSLLQCISDSLRMNRVGESVVNELSGLNRIIKLPGSDLTKNRLFITSRKFGRTTTMIVFLVEIKFFVNFADSTKANSSLGMYLAMRIALGKKRNNRGMFSSRSRSHGSGKKLKSRLIKVQHINHGHMTLFIVLTVYLDQSTGHK
jgi:hypothetical protein